jgi:hypothetical protein
MMKSKGVWKRMGPTLIGLMLVGGCSDRASDGSRASHTPLSPIGFVGDSLDLAYPANLELIGETMVVGDIVHEYRVAVFDLGSRSLTGRFGRNGGGPGEVRVPWSIFVDASDSTKIWVLDETASRMSQFALNRTAGTGTFVRSLRVNLLNADGAVTGVWFTPKGAVLGGRFRSGGLLLADSTGAEILKRVPGSPPYSAADYADPAMLKQANQYHLVLRPDLSFAALVYRHAAQVDMINLSTGAVVSAMGPRTVPAPAVGAYPGGAARLGNPPDQPLIHAHQYMVTASQRYVYVAYCGCRARDMDKHNEPHIVHVYSWAGEFVTEIQLDRAIGDIEVSPDDSRFYAIIFDPFPAIAVYALRRFPHAGR